MRGAELGGPRLSTGPDREMRSLSRETSRTYRRWANREAVRAFASTRQTLRVSEGERQSPHNPDRPVLCNGRRRRSWRACVLQRMAFALGATGRAEAADGRISLGQALR